MLETQTGNKLQSVRTDRGAEYLNAQLEGFFKKKGVKHETTAPYTPQQNGAAERFNRTLMERVRAMLFDAQQPKDMWAEAAVTATYIRNRSPTTSRAQTPWELCFGRKPDVSGMKVFGARAYVHVPKHGRFKLDSRTKAGTFLGYEPNSKAYRVPLDDDDKMVVSRDVTFDESPAQTNEGTEILDLSNILEELSMASEESFAFEEDTEPEADTVEAATQEATTQEATTQGPTTQEATTDSSIVPQGTQQSVESRQAKKATPGMVQDSGTCCTHLRPC